MSAPIISATKSTPFLYRLTLLTLEPICAVLGAYSTYFTPAGYLETMTRGLVPYATSSRFLYTELSGAWLYFAFVEAVVLRAYDDLRLWRLLCAGMLLSDVLYCTSAVQAVGGWASWATLGAWTAGDWSVFVASLPPMLVRIFLILGIGITPVVASSVTEKQK
ncbi:hypothetical protein PT974_01292 [Cladobotryum mycophilum]|uniref:DUF7704 domain-containing protein n=1 Tax=Cladobotryum mycophilum TaxID=491253 RepID=A0ABR0T389_9HYPO